MRRKVKRSARSHAHTLNGLKEFSFRLDRRRDDNLRLLKFGNISSANVAHAGSNRTDQILAAIVNFSRTKQDLFQRARGAHLDPGPSREIGVRRGHSPMVSTAGRFVRLGEGTSHHDSVGTAGECLANIAASAHSAISDDWHVARCFFEVSVARRRAINRRSNLRNTESKHTARGASRTWADTDQNRGRPTLHNFESHVIPYSVSDNHGNAHLTATLFQIERLVLRRNVSHR